MYASYAGSTAQTYRNVTSFQGKTYDLNNPTQRATYTRKVKAAETRKRGEANNKKLCDGAGKFFDQLLKGSYSKNSSVLGTIGEIILGGIPIIGDAGDIRDAIHGFQTGNLAEVAAAGMGLIPFVGGDLKEGAQAIIKESAQSAAKEAAQNAGKKASGLREGRTFKSQYDIPVNEQGYTKSSLQLGRDVHKEYKVKSVNNTTTFKEYTLPSGKRVDFIDFETKTIHYT